MVGDASLAVAAKPAAVMRIAAAPAISAARNAVRPYYTLSRLSWGDVGVDALGALSCPVNEPPVRGAQR